MTATTGMWRRWRRRSRKPVEPVRARPPLDEWLDRYATDHRPVLRVAESELVMLADIVCRELGVLDSQTPTDAQAAVVHSRVAAWVTDVRRQTRLRSPGTLPRGRAR